VVQSRKKSSGASSVKQFADIVQKKISDFHICMLIQIFFSYLLKVFFILFLLLFSYVLLCEFNFYEIPSISKLNSSSNESYAYINETINQTSILVNSSSNEIVVGQILNKPSILQYLLIFWVFSFFVEELRQVKDKSKQKSVI
jgi:hypothetical protein